MLGRFIGALMMGRRAARPIPARALLFSDQTPLQFSDGSYLEFSA